MYKRKILAIFTVFTLTVIGCGGSGGGDLPPGEATFTVGGTVSGVAGTLVLQNNGADDYTITQSGVFTFATAVANGSLYAVAIKTEPSGQTCSVANGTGTVTGANVTNIVVACYDRDDTNLTDPVIISVNPAEAKVGDQIQIAGTGFGSAQGSSNVGINGVQASSIIAWSDTVITAVVPDGATTGSVIVTGGGVASNSVPIVVLWAKENPENVAIDTAAGDQYDIVQISDDSGGAIMAWTDKRSGNYDIYAQRVNSTGVPQWAADGVAISTVSGDQYGPTLISDGSGGAIITWTDDRSGNSDIYAQRVNSSGVVQWTVDGVAISTAASIQASPKLISDGSGGAIITWYDDRGGNYDIYAQRVNSTGVPQWAADGVAISTAANTQYKPALISDGLGGAIITWTDDRGGNYDIYAQRVNSSGAAQWTTDGAAISTAADSQNEPTLISDGSGGAVITWYDNRSGIPDIYAQRVNSSGAVQWTADGVAISTASGEQYEPCLISDGSGGAMITWFDYRSGDWDIYVQRVNSSGVVQWTADGVAISTAADEQSYSQIVSDGSGGAIITWQDYRGGGYDIYAQRVNSSGAAQWPADGAAISMASGDQRNPDIVSDGSGGAIITWFDSRNGNYDIYAQGVSASGGQ